MLCCANGIDDIQDPFGWGCRKACEEGTIPPPPDEPFVPACWDVEPVGPGPTCLTYKACDTYAGANARCFCMCMGSDPWSDFVRACLACHYRRGDPMDYAHSDCYAEADRRYGERDWEKIEECALTCWTWQFVYCFIGVSPF